jgi:hypothetical protein
VSMEALSAEEDEFGAQRFLRANSPGSLDTLHGAAPAHYSPFNDPSIQQEDDEEYDKDSDAESTRFLSRPASDSVQHSTTDGCS